MLLEKIFVKSKTMQIKKLSTISLVLLSGLLTLSCSHSVEVDYSSGQGGITIDLATNVATATKAEILEGSLDVNQFRVEILNSNDVIIKRWMTYAEYLAEEDKTIPLNANRQYKIVATYGEPYAVGFDVVYFRGEKEFTVLPQETTNLEVTCTMANAKIGVEFGDIMMSEYKDIVAKVYNRYGALEFTKDNVNENGYIPAETLTLDVQMTSREDGQTYYFRRSNIEIQPRDYKVLKLDTEETPESGVTINLIIDDQTENITEEILIPSMFLPLDAPIINTDGFDQNGVANFTESVNPSAASIAIIAEATIKSFTMSIESSTLLSLGYPSVIDMLNIPAGTKALMDQHKLIYPIEKGLATVDFKEFAQIFRYNAKEDKNTHTFTFTVIDTLGKKTEKTVKLIPVEANKSINNIPEGDVWARKVYLTMSTSNGDASRLFPEISVDGGDSWKKATYTTQSISATTHKVVITGVEPGTSYQLRAAYNDYGAAETKTITTEAAAQLTNNTFEAWTDKTFSDGRRGTITWYQPWDSYTDEFWAVNSPIAFNVTTTNPGTFGAETYHRMSPLVAYSTDNHTSGGSKSAHIFNVQLGNYVTNTTIATSSKTYCGELFVGSADAESGAHTKDGNAFGSRPDRIEFWYKYAPVNNEKFYVKVEFIAADGSVIYSKEITDGPAASSWTKYSLPIDYSDRTKKAASVMITFKSAASANTIKDEKDLEIGGESINAYFGSSLRIDDINLIYE